MRSHSNGPIATFLMLAPLLAVPLLAVFGVPQFDSEESAESKSKKISEKLIDLGEADATGFNADEIFETSKEIDTVEHTSDLESPFHKHDSSTHAPIRYANNTAPQTGLEGWEVGTQSNKGDDLRVTSSKSNTSDNSNRETKNERFRAFDSSQFEDDFAFENDHKFAAHQHPNSSHALEDSGVENHERASNASSNNGTAMASIAPKANEGNPFSKYDEQPHHKQASHTTPVSQNESTPPENWATAVKRLNRLGIREFQLTPGARPNEFLFRCSFTPQDNPRITHRFEAEATEPLRAVQKVVLQVEKWMQRS